MHSGGRFPFSQTFAEIQSQTHSEVCPSVESKSSKVKMKFNHQEYLTEVLEKAASLTSLLL